MFTSRAEYRILLRQDNADLRLTETGYKIGLAKEDRLEKVLTKKNNLSKLIDELKALKVNPEQINSELGEINTSAIRERVSAASLLKRPQIGIPELRKLHKDIERDLSKYNNEVLEQADILIKYESYIDREQKLAEKIESLENYKIWEDFDYDRVKALSSEAREKLKKIRPETIGQVSRISGVSPADVSVLTVYLGK
jgi:tRNA uridine 5-carboxymethylaminomethyl modification enzyme